VQQFFQSLSKDKTPQVEKKSVKTINEIRNIEITMLMDPILPMETHHHGHNMAAVIDQHDSGQHAGHMQLNHQPMDIEQEREVLLIFLVLFEQRLCKLVV